MNQHRSFSLVIIPLALTVAGILMLCPLGFPLSPVAKFFAVFVVAIIGLQSVPAILVLPRVVKQIASKKSQSQPKQLIQGKESKTKLQILIASCDTEEREMLEDFFNHFHFQIESTASAAYAIAKIVQKHEPLVILGDSFEENINPAEVIALMRKCNKNLPIILASEDSSLETLQKVRETGIFNPVLKSHIKKNNEELRSVIKCTVDGFQPAMF